MNKYEEKKTENHRERERDRALTVLPLAPRLAFHCREYRNPKMDGAHWMALSVIRAGRLKGDELVGLCGPQHKV